MKAALALEDGTVVEGYGFGAEGLAQGELVFNTSMTGYVETLTDPSYAGQILMMTYPLIGNYGVCSEDYESDRIQTNGFVIKHLCRHPSNWRSQKNLDKFLKEFNVPGIEGVDTRMLTLKARIHGTMKATLAVFKSKDMPSLESFKKIINFIRNQENCEVSKEELLDSLKGEVTDFDAESDFSWIIEWGRDSLLLKYDTDNDKIRA